MITINIDKLYKYERRSEPCSIGFPLPQGELKDTDHIRLQAGGSTLPVQSKVTARYEDGSIKFVFLRFLADIPANKGMTVDCELHADGEARTAAYHPVSVEQTEDGLVIKTESDGGETFLAEVKNHAGHIFERIEACGTTYTADRFEGPVLSENKNRYDMTVDSWQIIEKGPLCAIVSGKGCHTSKATGKKLAFEVRLTAWAGKPWIETAYRIINTDAAALNIESLRFGVTLDGEVCGAEKPLRTCVATSNYTTDYQVSETGETVSKTIDADWLINEANEHFAEVFYGTFFADVTGSARGVCATIFQAHQNFPKAVEAGKDGINILLVPEGVSEVVMQSGMAREQKFLLHFHRAQETLEALNDRSIVYQMPYRPWVAPEVHAKSGVWPDVFPASYDCRVEQNLSQRADAHGRAYGMLNFGDSFDANYTAQGRGNGRLVWCNNEYDYPHACAILYARTGVRRYLDYNIASAAHWMDVDVCHWHTDPLYLNGQWEHTAGHVINGVMACSHQWVEGLLDYYHFTGDERGLSAAIGIGHNVQGLLDTPMFAKVGGANARETGWALRSLIALYRETYDKSWLVKCERIIEDFRVWEETYGGWMAPYTDNTQVRVPFMISVAVGSLMRYYNVFPSEELKAMILRQVDDLIESCYVKEWGVFYYKELPSLNRVGNNTLLLEALTAAYDLSGDKKYLTYGLETFRSALRDGGGFNTSKRKTEDTVLVGNASTKTFGQSFLPISGYYRALAESGVSFE